MGKLRGNSKGNEYTLYDDGAGVDEHEMASLADEFWRSGFEDDSDALESKVEIRNCLAGIVYRTPKEVHMKRNQIPMLMMLDHWSSDGSGDSSTFEKGWSSYTLAG